MRQILFPFFFVSMISQAQPPRVFPLYPKGGIPLSKICEVAEKVDTTKEGKRPSRISQITEPRIWFYPASKQKDSLRRAMLVLPGGGYSFVSVENEGRKMGERLSAEGFDVFVLLYRLPLVQCQTESKWVPLTDAMAALKRVQEGRYDKVGLIGFSAGGHLASSLITLNEKNPHHPPVPMPNGACLVYPVIDFEKYRHTGSRKKLLGADTLSDAFQRQFSTHHQVYAGTPPCYLIHSADDKAVPWQNSWLFSEALLKQGIRTEFHLFPEGGHGFGLGPSERKGAPEWLPLFLQFFSGL